jgi:hypothetical protein
VNLTFPSEDVGRGKIRYYPDKPRSGQPPVIVGSWERDGRHWKITLYSAPGQAAPGDETARVKTLNGHRQVLLDRIERDGKWWSHQPGAPGETTALTGKDTADA